MFISLSSFLAELWPPSPSYYPNSKLPFLCVRLLLRLIAFPLLPLSLFFLKHRGEVLPQMPAICSF